MNGTRRLMMAFLATTVARAAHADRLIMEDGTVHRGDVTRVDGGYALATSNGQRMAFDLDDVKRARYEARVTPEEAVAMVAELNGLALPLLEGPEPEQFVFINDVRTFNEQESFDAAAFQFDASRSRSRVRPGRRGFRRRSFSASASRADRALTSIDFRTVERDKTADNVFADEWLRYVAEFEALANDPRYASLTDARRRSDSLGDFARRPPQGCAATASVVRSALIALDDCLELAEDTRKRVDALPRRVLAHNEDIRELENALALELDRLETTRHFRRQERRVQRAEDRLRRRIAERDSEIARSRRVAERKINDFARARAEARRQLLTAELELRALAVGP
jgi:hypothetical protein